MAFYTNEQVSWRAAGVPTACSVPGASELSVVGSSIAVKSRMERKRIQNRMAQRTYRQRVKARLAELQARVENDQQNGVQQTDDNHSLMTSTYCRVTDESCQKSPILDPTLTRCAVLDGVHQESSYQEQSATLQVHHSQNARLAGDTTIGELKSILDQTGSPQHQLDGTIWQDDANFHANSSVGLDTNLESRVSRDQLLDTLGDAWKPKPSCQRTGTASLVEASSNSTRTSDLSYTPPDLGVPAKQTSLNDRLECVMECVINNGFENFDALVTAYYNGIFAESSPLAYEQRLSRTRRLPKVIADVCHTADQWDSRERRGLQEEIVKTTENLLSSEGDDAQRNFTECIMTLAQTQAQDMTNKTCSPGPIKRMMENELPTRWALMMGLAAENRAAWQRDRSDIALAAIVLLHFAGRIPKEQLLRLLSTLL
uniref:TqaK n=1 Tax=Penicillium aethiopicum TaxID=36650 RepID=F1CWE0_PENAE|nr:TqaK [Penicillium aethiopicum]